MSDYSWVTDDLFDERLEKIVAERYGDRAMQLVRDHAPDAWSDIRESLNNVVLSELEDEREGRLSSDPFDLDRRLDAAIPDWYRSPDTTTAFAYTQGVREMLKELAGLAAEAALGAVDEEHPQAPEGVRGVLGKDADYLITERAGYVVNTTLTTLHLVAWVQFLLMHAPRDRTCPVVDCSFALGLHPEEGFNRMMEGIYCHHVTRLAENVVAGLVKDGVLVKEEDLPEPEEDEDDE